MKPQRTSHNQSKLEKEQSMEASHSPDFKMYYRTIVTKTAWYWYKNRHNTNETKSPCTCGHLVFNKGAKNINEDRQSLQYFMFRKLGVHMQKNEIGSLSHITYESRLKIDQRFKYKIRNCLNEKKNIGIQLLDVILGHNLLDMTPKSQARKVKQLNGIELN